jgi:hypothetical protein
MTNFIEKTYKENGVQITKLKTVGRALRLTNNSYLDIMEIDINPKSESWMQRRNREIEEKQIVKNPVKYPN